MVTSSEFDNVLVPVDYQNNVLMRTFDTLIGFNKKNKKGKFMKAIKEEWVYDPVTKKQIFRDREAERREFQKKKDNGTYKVINLDAKETPKKIKTDSEKKSEAEKKIANKELYTGHLLNKAGKTLGQIEKETREKVRVPRAIRKERVEPGDTHYTCEEMANLIWKNSSKAKEKYTSPLDIWDKLLENEALRKKWDEKLINKFGHKPEDQVKKVRKPKTAAEKVELETDLEKITDWFWDKRNTSSFKILFPDVADRALLYRLIKNDDRGIKWFAKLMAKNGYRKQAEKPFEKKVVLIKKEKPEAAWSFDDAVKTLKPAIKRVQKAYEDADQRIGVGINWTMEELFGTGWERI